MCVSQVSIQPEEGPGSLFLSPSVEYGWSERGRLRPSVRARPSSERLELKFSAVGNAVSLFPKEKYPAARFEAAGDEGRDREEQCGRGNSQLLFILRVPRLAITLTRSPTPLLQLAAVPGALGQLKLSLD